MQVIIRLHQGIIELMHSPHDGMVLCKGGIQGSDPVYFIVSKDLFVPGGRPPMTGDQEQPGEKDRSSD
jgi:hypothetical protein